MDDKNDLLNLMVYNFNILNYEFSYTATYRSNTQNLKYESFTNYSLQKCLWGFSFKATLCTIFIYILLFYSTIYYRPLYLPSAVLLHYILQTTVPTKYCWHNKVPDKIWSCKLNSRNTLQKCCQSKQRLFLKTLFFLIKNTKKNLVKGRDRSKGRQAAMSHHYFLLRATY